MLLNARRLDNPDGAPEKILLGIQDITKSKETREALKISSDQLIKTESRDCANKAKRVSSRI